MGIRPITSPRASQTRLESVLHDPANDFPVNLRSTVMAAKPATNIPQETALIAAFAATQMSDWVRQRIEESTFLELAVCAFFFGAQAQFRKFSPEDSPANWKQLIAVVMDIGNISESKTIALIKTIYRLADRYYLIENIIEQGRSAAEQWLNCRDNSDEPLHSLVRKYQNLSMFDLGIEGVNENYQQQVLYAAVDQSVGKLRRRALVLLLIIAVLAAALSVYLLHR